MKVKIIHKNGEFVAVNLENLNIFRVDETEADILSSFCKGMSISEIASELGVSEEKCGETVQFFSTLPRGVELVPEETGTLDELLLMIALDCNMRCGYCYGDGGSYHRERSLMSTETAFKAIDTAQALGDIKVITLFGGEPLLNFEVIKDIVEKTEPAIISGIITNGTIMNKEIAEFIKAHRIPLTISIDGPQPVHDASRVYPDGRGTHYKVVQTMEMLKKAGIPFAVEATYTKQAAVSGYSAQAILEYLYQFTPTINFASVSVTTDPVYKLSPQESRDFRIQCIDFVFDKIQKGEPINLYDITALISSIASPKRVIPKTFCPFHARRVAVFPNGDVFPCYLLMDEKYEYGNIFDPDFVKNFPRKREKILPRICRDQLTHTPWFTPLLTHICVSTLLPEGDQFSMNKNMLDTGPEITEHLLYRMSQIRNWNTFFENL